MNPVSPSQAPADPAAMRPRLGQLRAGFVRSPQMRAGQRMPYQQRAGRLRKQQQRG